MYEDDSKLVRIFVYICIIFSAFWLELWYSLKSGFILASKLLLVIAGYMDDEFPLENQSLSYIINLKKLKNLLHMFSGLHAACPSKPNELIWVI